MAEPPQKRRRSKSAPSPVKRPPALRRPSVPSKPSERVRAFLVEKKRERESSTASSKAPKNEKVKSAKSTPETAAKEAKVKEILAAQKREKSKGTEKDTSKDKKNTQNEKTDTGKEKASERSKSKDKKKDQRKKNDKEKDASKEKERDDKKESGKEKDKDGTKQSKKKDKEKDAGKENAKGTEKDSRKEKKKDKDRKKEEKSRDRDAGKAKEAGKDDKKKEKSQDRDAGKVKQTGKDVKKEGKSRERDAGKAKETDNDAKTAEAEKNEAPKKNNKKEKEPPITFVPSKKSKVEHIFTTPIKSDSASASSGRMLSSKEKAEMHLRSLGNILQETDEDSESVDATDMEEFLKGIQEKRQDEAESDQGDEEEAEGSENEEESEEEGKGEADKSLTEKTEEEDETSDEGEDHEEEEEEEDEEQEESDDEGEEGREKDGDDEGSSEESLSGDEEVEEEDGDDHVQPPKPEEAIPAADQHALVPITKATSEATEVVRNSTTNKREWDAYCRQLKANSKIPCQISEYAQASASQKTDLFGMWLDSNRDWNKCQLLLERKIKQEHEAERGWCAIQGRDLKAKYQNTPEKADKLIASRKSQGLWYPDDDFPDDDDESRLLLGCFVFTFTYIPPMCCIPSSTPKKFDDYVHLQLHANIVHPGFKKASYANLCNHLSLLYWGMLVKVFWWESGVCNNLYMSFPYAASGSMVLRPNRQHLQEKGSDFRIFDFEGKDGC